MVLWQGPRLTVSLCFPALWWPGCDRLTFVYVCTFDQNTFVSLWIQSFPIIYEWEIQDYTILVRSYKSDPQVVDDIILVTKLHPCSATPIDHRLTDSESDRRFTSLNSFRDQIRIRTRLGKCCLLTSFYVSLFVHYIHFPNTYIRYTSNSRVCKRVVSQAGRILIWSWIVFDGGLSERRIRFLHNTQMFALWIVGWSHRRIG